MRVLSWSLIIFAFDIVAQMILYNGSEELRSAR